jgi:hypothetical protein
MSKIKSLGLSLSFGVWCLVFGVWCLVFKIHNFKFRGINSSLKLQFIKRQNNT